MHSTNSSQFKSSAVSTAVISEQTTRILIVDDDMYFRQMLKTLLMAQGFDVMEARSTNEGESFLRHRPDLAIVDYRLPGTDGAVWIKTLRDRGLKFPIVFCSGSSYSSQVLTNLRNVLQVELIVRKPIAPREFVNQLQALLPQQQPAEAPGLQAMLAQAVTQNLPAARDPHQICLGTTSGSENGLPPYEEEPICQKVAFGAPSTEPSISYLLGQLFGDTSQDDLPVCEATEEDRAAAQAEDDAAEQAETEFALRELSTSYLNDMPSMVIAIKADLHQAESAGQSEFLELAATHAHSMRGTAGSLGFFEISKIAAALEDRLREAMAADTLAERSAEIHDLVHFLHQTINCEQANRNTSVTAYRIAPLNKAAQSPAIKANNTANNAANNSAGASIKPYRIMVVDDGFGESAALCLSLRDNHHCETTTVSDPAKVITQLDQYKPDMLFVGTNPDGKNGYDICRLIRCNQKWWDLPLVLMTEDCSVETRVEIYDSGATDFIARPIIEAELTARLNAHLYKK